ncbi:hypothetical protein F9L07_28455 [Pimelobacter simplex]|uniref:Uncharacterized protein n=1 Tax=Nocardioides simplex TaxID=2045 RepID=A0A7J5DQX3_NOCSI|nr:hypothetical protein [Pimelobacter simplex]KAB2806967.1 hypothetical protein F9L07_28455 [Pimelobacter simplex]
MAWFKVDDKLHDHRKTRKVRRSHPTKKRDVAPFGIWGLAGSWCGSNDTDGFIPLEVLEEWDDDAEGLAGRLVAAGLWVDDEVDGERGYRFHEYAERNPVSGEDPADYGRRGNHVRWHEARGVIDPKCPFCSPRIGGDHRGESGAESSRPGPTRPDPTAAAGDRAAAAAVDGPVDNHHGNVAIEILADKLRQHTLLRTLRTDKLTEDWETRIVALIERHGDQRLVDAALAGLRRDDPPRLIQAFVGAWEAMPAAGKRVAAVPAPTCTEPGHTGTTRHCVQCASERKAAR